MVLMTACSQVMTKKNVNTTKPRGTMRWMKTALLRDPTLKHPRCVLNLLKEHVSRYTPEVVNNICGTPIKDFLQVCEYLAETSAKDKNSLVLIRIRLDSTYRGCAKYPYHGDDPITAG